MILSEYSITLTSEPNLLYTCPSSKPITPPPIITKCFGISFKESASVDVITLFLSIFINGKDIGLDPVAIIHLSNITLTFFSAIFNVLLLTKDALPSNTVILFLFIK